MSKLALNGTIDQDATQSRQILRELLEQILLLLHPVMPFVTEEIWQLFGSNRPSIMIQQYPKAEASWLDWESEKQMDLLMGVVRAIRNLRTELNCPPGKEVEVIFCAQETDLTFLSAQRAYLRVLARVGSADFRPVGDGPKGAVTAVVGGTEIYLPLDDLVNFDEEHARLLKEIGKVEEEFSRVHKKLTNNEFIAKAKQEVIEKERDKARQFEEKIRALRVSLDKLEEIRAGRS